MRISFSSKFDVKKLTTKRMQTLKEKKNKNDNVLYTYKSLSFFFINERINTLNSVVYPKK